MIKEPMFISPRTFKVYEQYKTDCARASGWNEAMAFIFAEELETERTRTIREKFFVVENEPQTNKGVSYSDHTDYDEPRTYVTWTEPQTYKPTCNGECRYCIYRAKDGNYCMKTDCVWK